MEDRKEVFWWVVDERWGVEIVGLGIGDRMVL